MATLKISVLKTPERLHLDTVRLAKELHLSFAGVRNRVDKVEYMQVIKSDDQSDIRRYAKDIAADFAPGRKTFIEWS